MCGIEAVEGDVRCEKCGVKGCVREALEGG